MLLCIGYAGLKLYGYKPSFLMFETLFTIGSLSFHNHNADSIKGDSAGR